MNAIKEKIYLSNFIVTFEKDGVVAIFHQLHPEVIYLENKEWIKIISKIRNGELLDSKNSLTSELLSRKLIIKKRNDDIIELKKIQNRSLKNLNKAKILYLVMAEGCNFSCKYCPIPKRTKQSKGKLLSYEHAVAGIELWKKHLDDIQDKTEEYYIIFYGGEPLLNSEMFEKILPYIKKEKATGKLPHNLILMLSTNGSLIDDRLIKILKKYNVLVAVAIDGPEEADNIFRLTNNGKKTFKNTIKIIKKLAKNKVNLACSVTITPQNVSRLEGCGYFMKSIGIKNFGFNLMKGRALLEQLGSMNIAEYYEKAAKCVASNFLTSHHQNIPNEFQLSKKLIMLQEGLPFSIDCSCGGNQIVLNPDGHISNCPFLKYNQGHISSLPSNFKIWNTAIVKKWQKRIPIFNNILLKNSKGVVLDGGGCAWSAHELSGNIKARDEGNVIFTNELIKELIWKVIPKKNVKRIIQGKDNYWSYRRIGDM